MKRITGILLAVLGFAGIVWADNPLSLTGAGATFPYPMYSKWFSEYHKKDPNIQINYQSIGSGGGIRQVTEGTVDFGASDGPMTDEQLKAYQDKHGFAVLHFPTVLGGVVPTYNIPGVSGELKFTPEALVLVTMKTGNPEVIFSITLACQPPNIALTGPLQSLPNFLPLPKGKP